MVGFCFVGWAVFVVPHGLHQGLSQTQSSFLPTAFGLGNVMAFLQQKQILGYESSSLGTSNSFIPATKVSPQLHANCTK